MTFSHFQPRNWNFSHFFSPQFFPPKLSSFSCPTGNSSCSLSYAPGEFSIWDLGLLSLKTTPGEGNFGVFWEFPVFFPSEIPGERFPGANGQWRSSKPRGSRASFLETRKNSRCVGQIHEFPCFILFFGGVLFGIFWGIFFGIWGFGGLGVFFGIWGFSGESSFGIFWRVWRFWGVLFGILGFLERLFDIFWGELGFLGIFLSYSGFLGGMGFWGFIWEFWGFYLEFWAFHLFFCNFLWFYLGF